MTDQQGSADGVADADAGASACAASSGFCEPGVVAAALLRFLNDKDRYHAFRDAVSAASKKSDESGAPRGLEPFGRIWKPSGDPMAPDIVRDTTNVLDQPRISTIVCVYWTPKTLGEADLVSSLWHHFALGGEDCADGPRHR